jgi:hypothetical protein
VVLSLRLPPPIAPHKRGEDTLPHGVPPLPRKLADVCLLASRYLLVFFARYCA